MRTSSRPARPTALPVLALLLFAYATMSAGASESTAPPAGAQPGPPALKTLDLSSLGQPAPTDQRPGKAPALSASPYT